MKALLSKPPGAELTNTQPQPVPGTAESLVKVTMAGICRTDLELTKGYMGFEGILGHEFCGIIDDNHSPLPKNTRVVGEINAGCGQCEWCGKGLERHCPNRTVLGIFKRNGCMAEWLALPFQNLYPIPDCISDEQATFIEPVAAVLEIFEQMKIEPMQKVCIIGDGKLGLLSALVFRERHEGEILLIGHHSSKLNRIRNLTDVRKEEEITNAMHKSWDVVVEATGSSKGLFLGMQLVKPRGTIVLKSTMAQAEPLDLTPIVIDEITVMGSRCGRFLPAISLLSKGRIALDRLIDGIYPFEKAEDAWKHAQKRDAMKILIRIS